MCIHIYIPKYIYTYHIHLYTLIDQEPQQDLVGLRTQGSNIEFVKNSYYLYVTVLVWVLLNS